MNYIVQNQISEFINEHYNIEYIDDFLMKYYKKDIKLFHQNNEQKSNLQQIIENDQLDLLQEMTSNESFD